MANFQLKIKTEMKERLMESCRLELTTPGDLLRRYIHNYVLRVEAKGYEQSLFIQERNLNIIRYRKKYNLTKACEEFGLSRDEINKITGQKLRRK